MPKPRKKLDLTTFEGQFATRLVQLREAAGLDGDEAAEKMGVNYNTLQKWENGENRPKITLLPMIAQFYGVKVRDLMPEDF